MALGRGRSITSTRLTTRARRRTDRLRSYGSVTLRVRLVTELRYGTGFYKNPYVPVVTFLSWLFHSENGCDLPLGPWNAQVQGTPKPLHNDDRCPLPGPLTSTVRDFDVGRALQTPLATP